MNSQLTLVEPIPGLFVEPGVLQPTAASAVFFVSPDNVKKCTISLRTDNGERLAYTVHSDLALTYMTIRRPFDTNSEPFVYVERREIVSDRISFHGGERFKVNKWLKPLKMFSTFPVSFEEKGRGYVWKRSIVGQLSMYAEDDLETPITWYQCSRKVVIQGAPTVLPAFLVIQPEAIGIQDMVVVSFLILEHKSRMNTKQDDLQSGVASYGGLTAGDALMS